VSATSQIFKSRGWSVEARLPPGCRRWRATATAVMQVMLNLLSTR
jgi:hypothetical protein